ERRLEGVLDVLGIRQHAPADAMHHRPVTTNQFDEGGLALIGHEAVEQIPVGGFVSTKVGGPTKVRHPVWSPRLQPPSLHAAIAHPDGSAFNLAGAFLFSTLGRWCTPLWPVATASPESHGAGRRRRGHGCCTG